MTEADDHRAQPAPSSQSSVMSAAGRDRRAMLRFVVLMVLMLGLDLGGKAAAFRWLGQFPIDMAAGPQAVVRQLAHVEPVTVAPRLLALRLWINEGAVFGFGQGGRWVFAAVSVLAVGIVWRVFSRSDAKRWGLHLALAGIVAGALGNLYDRLRFGAVRDMLHLFPDVNLPFGWTWPGTDQSGLYPWIFNPADMWLVGGVILVLLLTWRQDDAPRPSAGETGRD